VRKQGLTEKHALARFAKDSPASSAPALGVFQSARIGSTGHLVCPGPASCRKHGRYRFGAGKWTRRKSLRRPPPDEGRG
jgi:hypothetical protein